MIQGTLDSIIFLKNYFRYNNKTYRIAEIDFNASPKSTFEDSQGNAKSYIEYYKTRYSLLIEDAGQPLLISLVESRVRSTFYAIKVHSD